MDPVSLSNGSVLEALLKTNRPPTAQEKAIIDEYMLPTKAKFEVTKAQISDAIAHIEALKLQIGETEIKLQRLREEEAAILETFADHRRVLSPFRNLPGDMLRELCVACVETEKPTLSYGNTPLPYKLAQISSELRYIALTTPYMWASMRIQIYGSHIFGQPNEALPYSILARKAREWFQQAGGLALNIHVEDFSYDAGPSNILLDLLLSYSSRWKTLRINFSNAKQTPITRITALTAVEVPQLQSISLNFQCATSVFRNSTFLTIPTLRRLTLQSRWNSITDFSVDWAILTSLTLKVKEREAYSSFPLVEIARILQKTKRLVFCNIAVGQGSENHPGKIGLPLLEILCIEEHITQPIPAEPCSILDLMNVPVLSTFKVRERFLKLSLSAFLERTPSIRTLSLRYVNQESLTNIAESLRHCSSLSVLSVRPWERLYGYKTLSAENFIREFFPDENVGTICPRLECFSLTGNIDFSLEVLQRFLEGKQGHTALNTLIPWKRVAFDIQGISDAQIYQQMIDLVSQKRAAGLNVRAYKKRRIGFR